MLPPRFEEKFIPEPNSGCWLWLSTIGSCGYGEYWRGAKSGPGPKFVRAHRYAYECLRGPIPDGLVVDHLCKTRCCVNPDHMELVTAVENTKRGRSGWNMRAKTHCPHGHPYEGDNLRIINGRRTCRICNNAKQRACTARKRLALSENNTTALEHR